MESTALYLPLFTMLFSCVKSKLKLFVLFLVFASFQSANAGRPLITDDSGAVGSRNFQIETWALYDKRALQHWIVPTIGIGNSVEVSSAFVHGLSTVQGYQHQYATSGPITQGKVTLHEGALRGLPGIALAGGVIPPFGKGYFKTKEWEYYYYLASSYMPHEKWLIHLNVGRQTRRQLNEGASALLWGVALEYQTQDQQWAFLETTNGEIFSLIPDTAMQAGIRQNLSPTFQVDATLGHGLSGSPKLPLWGTLGIKRIYGF